MLDLVIQVEKGPSGQKQSNQANEKEDRKLL